MAHHLSAHAYVPPHRKLLICYNGVVYTYSCSQKLHIICICSNGMWAVRSSVRAVRHHCVNTNRYNTQHTSYTPCVSLKRTANKQTPCSTVLLEKSTTPQSVGKYGTGWFIAVCTTAQHLSLSGTRRIQP